MRWNWQRTDWTKFTYDSNRLAQFEEKFLLRAGQLFGITKHLNKSEAQQLSIDILSDEAMKTSEIEGEILSRESVQSSVKRHFGLQTASNQKILAAEDGIAELMVDLYQNSQKLLTEETLFRWHKMILRGNQDLQDIGRYRTHEEPMQVVSGYVHKRKVHFEAPPSKQVPKEMSHFMSWYRSSKKDSQLSPLIRSGIAHLYFVSIHPFEDGNGRIARAISEKILSEGLKRPSLTGLSIAIQSQRKKYYQALEQANKHNEITDWLYYFSETVLEAQSLTESLLEFILQKTKFYDKYRDQLNVRQHKVVDKLLKSGPNGFTGGLSAEKYISITRTSRATATRDLQELLELGALTKTGELKHTRYWLKLSL